MNRIPVLIAATLLLAPAAPFAQPASAANPAIAAFAEPVTQGNDVLDKMEAAARKIKSLQASISQVRRDKKLGSKDRSTATIYYVAGAEGQERVLIEYATPAPQTISVVGDDVTIYQPEIKQAYQTTRKQAGAKNSSLGFLGLGYQSAGAQLRDKYDVTVLGDEAVDGKPTTVLELVPKDGGNIRKMTVWVDHATWLPIQYSIAEAAAETTMKFSNMKPNVSIDKKRFEIKYGPGTQVVRG